MSFDELLKLLTWGLGDIKIRQIIKDGKWYLE